MDVVVAHFREDLSWIQGLRDECAAFGQDAPRVFVYHKSARAPGASAAGDVDVELPNVGRESHTYLHHIVSQYDKIVKGPRVTFFAQGGLPEHVSPSYVLSSARCALAHGVSRVGAGEFPDPQEHAPTYGFRIKHWKCELTPNARDEVLGLWFERVTGKQFPLRGLEWIRGANFAVRNDLIAAHPKAYFEALIKECEASVSPETGHFFERTWRYILTPDVAYARTVPTMDAGARRALAKRVLLLQVDTRSDQVAGPALVYPNTEIRNHGEASQKFLDRNPSLKAKLQPDGVTYDSAKVEYWALTSKVNKMQAARWGASYEYIVREEEDGRAASWVKLQHLLSNARGERHPPADHDVIVMLDTDAWIRDMGALLDWIGHLLASDKLFLLADEPVNDESFAFGGVRQRVNGGFMVLRNRADAYPHLREIYDLPLRSHHELGRFVRDWPWEQICINKTLDASEELRAATMIGPLDLFNTPAGCIVRHSWAKHLIVPLIVSDIASGDIALV